MNPFSRQDRSSAPATTERQDFLEVPLDAPVKREDGTRVYDAIVASAGVHAYPWGLEYTPPEVVEAATASAAAIPLTVLSHPTENFRTLAEAAQRRVGVTSAEPRYENGQIRVKLIVDTEQGGDTIDTEGLAHISPGLDGVTVVHEPGVAPSGERYDYRRVSMRLNHATLLRPGEGRQGPGVRFRADAVGADAQSQDVTMPKMTIRGAEHEIPESAVAAVSGLISDLDKQTQRADAAERAKAEQAGALAVAESRADKAEQALQARQDSIATEQAQWLAAHEIISPVAARFDVALKNADGSLRPHADIRRDCVVADLGAEWADASRFDSATVDGAFRAIAAKGQRADASIRNTFPTNPAPPAPVNLAQASAGLFAVKGA